MDLLEVKNISKTYGSGETAVKALKNVSFSVPKGEYVAIVGESGSGKTTTAQAIIGLLADNARRDAGKIVLNGEEISRWSAKRLDTLRGARISLVPQDPGNSLNPVKTIGAQVGEIIQLHQKVTHAQRDEQVLALLKKVGLSHPEQRMKQYPHQLSGGMKQRVLIAIAIALSPDVIIADEPTSALDISVQAQILNLLVTLQQQRNLTYVLISHNVSVVRHMSDRVAVMYLGQIVELGSAAQVLGEPRHPYTRLLLDSVPRTGEPLDETLALRKTELPGNRRLPEGCFFRDRCPMAAQGCERPQPLQPSREGRDVRCWRSLG